MKRSSLSRLAGPALAMALLACAGLVSAALAQSPAPMSAAENAVVGTWVLDTNVNDPSNPPADATFHADGTYIQADLNGIGVGAWESTGPDSGTLTFVEHAVLEDGTAASVTVRGTFEVAADGQSLTAAYTAEFSIGEVQTGQQGPGAATGTRVVVEPMGSPVGPLTGPPSSVATPSMAPASMAP